MLSIILERGTTTKSKKKIKKEREREREKEIERYRSIATMKKKLADE